MEGAEGGPAVVEGTGGEAEGGGRANGRGFGADAPLLAAGGVAFGGEAEPGGEVFFRGKGALSRPISLTTVRMRIPRHPDRLFRRIVITDSAAS